VVIEILTLTCIANALLALATFGLLGVCSRRQKALTSAIGENDWNHAVLQTLRSTLFSLAEPTWSESGRFVSLETVVPKVEEADPEQTIRKLLTQIASDCKSTFDGEIKLANLEQFTKSVYRLQSQFGLSDAAMADILVAAIERIKGSILLAKKVVRVELVKIDARVDEKTMWLLNPGLRVKQPFGLVLRTESGAVLSRAKAHCH
jgi:hypothetical protein